MHLFVQEIYFHPSMVVMLLLLSVSYLFHTGHFCRVDKHSHGVMKYIHYGKSETVGVSASTQVYLQRIANNVSFSVNICMTSDNVLYD